MFSRFRITRSFHYRVSQDSQYCSGSCPAQCSKGSRAPMSVGCRQVSEESQFELARQQLEKARELDPSNAYIYAFQDRIGYFEEKRRRMLRAESRRLLRRRHSIPSRSRSSNRFHLRPSTLRNTKQRTWRQVPHPHRLQRQKSTRKRKRQVFLCSRRTLSRRRTGRNRLLSPAQWRVETDGGCGFGRTSPMEARRGSS